eukprot:CAMPEP_0170544110 /NCGR_PEP_ID=MMETSP0211-20121228/2992_1 /TAXON_ID=311385 /ORGANISM="Pseudokeronopsis sp., Strain OXSARD2" /LENGTH=147 /DNA_ID=CAMNT_0010847675 /DNA_START=137 /DNA_END=583 /DNA_ORIENTATION=-
MGSALSKTQVFIQKSLFNNILPEEFPIIVLPESNNFEILPLMSLLIKQNQALAEKCLEKMNLIDEDYLVMMNDKMSADNNLYKLSLEKSEQIIKNQKVENDYLQKQMQNLREEMDKKVVSPQQDKVAFTQELKGRLKLQEETIAYLK